METRLSALSKRCASADPRIWLIAALLVATAARLSGLGNQSLWWDEGITYTRVALPVETVVQDLLEVRNQTPPYYFLLRGWCALFGTSEFSLRLPSAFAGIANVALVYLVGKIGLRRDLGVWAAWLLAVNPFHIWYSREARMYALIFLLITEAMRRFLLAIRRDSGRDWIALGAVGVAAYFTHYVSLAIGLVQFGVLLLTFQTTYRSLRKWVSAQVVSVVPALGWFMVTVPTHGFSGLRRPGIPVPTLLAPFKTFWNFSIGFDDRFTLLTGLGLLPFVAVLARRRVTTNRLWLTSLMAWLLLPPSLALVLSFLIRPCYMDRYLSVCLVAYVLWIATTLSSLPQGWWRTIAGTALIVAMAGSSIAIVGGDRLAKPDWRAAVSRVVEESRPGEHLIIGAGIRAAFYYNRRQAVSFQHVDGGAWAAALTEAVTREERVWVLYRDPTASASAHVLIQARRFDPLESGSNEIGTWLSDHPESVTQEWFFPGLYLALLEPGQESDDEVHPAEPS